jgi:hypothetical protein
MSQLSLIPALEAARYEPQMGAASPYSTRQHGVSPMALANRPTAAQIAYLKKLTRIRTDAQLARFVARQMGFSVEDSTKATLTRHHFAKVIDKEVAHKRWGA